MRLAICMLVLGIETSCDETGLALYSGRHGLLAHALHSQVEMHREYGGVVPELASRDHIRRVLPLLERILRQADVSPAAIDAVAFTQGPGLAGALLVGASIANGLGFAWERPVIGIHHLEGHLLSPLLASAPPSFPFVALLVSGGHTQLMEVSEVASIERWAKHWMTLPAKRLIKRRNCLARLGNLGQAISPFYQTLRRQRHPVFRPAFDRRPPRSPPSIGYDRPIRAMPQRGKTAARMPAMARADGLPDGGCQSLAAPRQSPSHWQCSRRPAARRPAQGLA